MAAVVVRAWCSAFCPTESVWHNHAKTNQVKLTRASSEALDKTHVISEVMPKPLRRRQIDGPEAQLEDLLARTCQYSSAVRFQEVK